MSMPQETEELSSAKAVGRFADSSMLTKFKGIIYFDKQKWRSQGKKEIHIGIKIDDIELEELKKEKAKNRIDIYVPVQDLDL